MCVVVDVIKTNQDVKILGEWRSGPRHDLLYRRLHRATKTNQPLTQTGLSLVPLWRRPHSLRLSTIENPVRPGLRLPAFSHMEQSLEGGLGPGEGWTRWWSNTGQIGFVEPTDGRPGKLLGRQDWHFSGFGEKAGPGTCRAGKPL